MEGLPSPAGHDLQHQQVELSQVHDLSALKAEITQLPVDGAVPLLIGLSLAGEDQGQNIVHHSPGTKGPAAETVRVEQSHPALERHKAAESSRGVPPWLFHRYGVKIVVDRLGERDLFRHINGEQRSAAPHACLHHAASFCGNRPRISL